MKIVHICLACFYVEGMGYQENLLPAHNAKDGHEVHVLTSDYAFDSKGKVVRKTQSDYVNSDGIHVRVLARSKKRGYFSRFNVYENVYGELQAISPDVIFVHGGQFISLYDVVKYVRRNKTKVKLYIDQHADYYNAPINTYKLKIVHKIIFGSAIRKAARLASKVWGVTPWRCQYLNDIYGVPKNKIALLHMGGDDRKIDFENAKEIREKIRNELNISQEDFVIVTGGKIDKTKNIHLLMKAVIDINRPDVKLIVFGQPNDAMQEEISKLSESESIRYIGWIPSDLAYNYFLSSDLGVFPGTHSVLWEQACACGLPCLYKDWEGMRHVNVEGSGDFLYKDSDEEMKEKILSLFENKDKYEAMKNAAEKHKFEFFYSEIAKRAIEQ